MFKVNQIQTKTLSFSQMWDVYRIWEKDNMLPDDAKTLFTMLYPNEAITKPAHMAQMIALGLATNSYDQFVSFIEDLFNGRR